MMTKSKWYRNPKNNETINYDCGCVFIIKHFGEKTNTGLQPFEVEISMFCHEHDPTLTEYAKENKEEYEDEMY